MSPSTDRQVPVAQPVRVPAAAPNAQSEIASTAGAKLQLEFDPNSASVDRVDNSLVFTFGNGGKVTVVDFFATGGAVLPNLQLPDGTEVTSAGILAALNPDMDLSTAAGSGAQASPPGSGTNYDDDGGTLISGVDRLDPLGTDYWDRTTEVPETYLGREVPGGAFGLDVTTSLGGAFGAGLFEDGRANQHIYGESELQVAGRIHFTFSPSGSTVVDAIRLSGFEPGARLFIGEPGEPGTIELTVNGAGQPVNASGGIFTFTHDQFTGPGVYILPPDNSDRDMSVTVQVDLRALSSGLTTTLNGGFTVIVDAVADRPEAVANALVDDGTSSHSMSTTVSQDTTLANGLEKTGYTVTAGENEGKVNVTLSVTATFNDFDGSEQHYMLVEQLPGFTGAYPTIEVNGVTYFQIPVDNALLAANGGSAALAVVLQAPRTTADTDFSVQTGAMAMEVPTDDELSTDNNTSIVLAQNKVDFTIDTINSALTVEAGWASEGNDPSKHTTSPYVPDYASMDNGAGVDSASTTVNGAPVTLRLGNNATGTAESIQSVTFTYDGARGALEYSGPGTVAQSAAPDGTVTFTISGINSDSLTGLAFKPATTGPQSYNDDDVTLNYTVTVTNTAGASAVLSGSSHVIIDAVAGKATDMVAGVNYNAGTTSVISGGTASLHIEAQFQDYTDGSEAHYLVIEPSVVANIDPSNLPSGMTLITGAEAAAFDSNTGLAGPHFIIKVDSSYLRANNGKVDFNLDVTVKGYSSDQSNLSVGIKAVAVEGDGFNMANAASGGELTADNNVAVSDVSTSINVNVIRSTISVAAGSAYEGDTPDANVGNMTPAGGAAITVSGLATDEHESISEAVFTFNALTVAGSPVPSGFIRYDGVDYSPVYNAGTGTYAVTIADFDPSKATAFIPGQNDSDADVDLGYKVTVLDSGSGETKAFTGNQTIIIDAVAGKATDMAAGVNYNAGTTSVISGGTASLHIEAQFQDYADGSEAHYLVIDPSVVANIDPSNLPSGMTLVTGAEAAAFDSNTGLVGPHFIIKVDPGYLQANNGKIDFNLDVTVKGYSSDQSNLPVGIKAVAVEADGLNTATDANSGELTADNNVAVSDVSTSINVNVISSTISVAAGSAYEDNMPDANVGNMTPAGGAAITVSGLAAGDHESISEAVFTFNAVDVNGSPVPSGFIRYDGVDYSPAYNAGTGAYAVTIADFDPSKATAFIPGQNNSDADVDLGYKITVLDSGSGETKAFTGNRTIVIDAVADKPVVEVKTDGSQVDYHVNNGVEQTAAKPGESVTLHSKVAFNDLDGSENHFVLVQQVPGVTYEGYTINGVSGTFGVSVIMNGISYYKIPVDDTTASFDVGITVNASPTADQKYNIIIGGLAVETATVIGGGELTEDNNTAMTTGTVGFQVSPAGSAGISVVNTYEDRNSTQHQGTTTTDSTWGTMRWNTTDSEGDERVAEIQLTYSGKFDDIGSLEYPAGAVGAATYDVAANTTTIRITGVNGADLGKTPAVKFIPAENSDKDFPFAYKVTIRDPKSGHTKETIGSSQVVVDAVADKPVVGIKTDGSQVDYNVNSGVEQTAAKPGESVTLHSKVAFNDLDGSENHFVLVQQVSGVTYQSYTINGMTGTFGTAVTINGVKYYKIPVDGATASFDVSVTVKASPTVDTNYNISIGGQAVETATVSGGGELTENNNTAMTTGTVGFQVAPAEAAAIVAVHTYEDRNSAQHLGGTTSKSAWGNITFSTKDTEGDERITAIKLTYAGKLSDIGSLESPAGAVVTENYSNGVTTVTITGGAGSLGKNPVIRFVPAADSDKDFSFTYEVTTRDPESGHTKVTSGSSKVIVDAVADKPTHLALDTTGNYMSPAQTAAKPGENVEFKIDKVQFHDYKDSSEKHYIVIGKNLTNDAGTQNTGTLRIAQQVLVINGVGPNGEAYAQTITIGANASSSSIVIAGPEGVISTLPMGAATYKSMMSNVDSHGNFKIPVLNEFLQLTKDGTVSASVQVVAPKAAADTGYKAMVGGYAQETASDSELDTVNNDSLTTGKIGFAVKPVTSAPKITITDSTIYENLNPEAHKANYKESAGAKIQVSGIDAGEKAAITLTFGSKNGVADFTSSDPADVMRIEYNGRSYPVTQGPDGKWTVTIEVAGSSKPVDGVLVFKPGHNYNSSDIKVGYNVTVTDTSSGHEATWNNTTPGSGGYQNNQLGIVVDAVAQAPDLDSVTADYGAAGGTTAFVRGGDVVLKTEATFEDYRDGSEKHFLLVEAKPGWTAPYKITLVDGNGDPILDGNKVPVTVPVSLVMQSYNGVMYYQIAMPNDYIRQYGTDGKVNAQVWIDSPDNAADTSFKVGAMAWEDAAKLDPNTELRYDNNTSIVMGGAIPVTFDKVGGLVLTPKSAVYENDTPNANVGNDTLAGGTRITLSHDADDKVTDFRFTNYDTGKGTLYYLPDSDPIGAGYEIPANGFAGDIKDGWSFVFVPAHNYSDADVRLSYTATVTNQNSGDSHTVGGGTTVIVDAVAQQPAVAGAEPNVFEVTHSTRVGEGDDASREVKISVSATFQDYEDSSEQHFVLVEAKANMVIHDANGNPYSIFHAPDGGLYYKIPVSNADILAGNGTAGISVALTIYSRMLGLSHPKDTLRVGALAQESGLSGDETTYHNNTAFIQEGEITIHHNWPKEYVIWVDPAYENNTPFAYQDDPGKPGMQPNEASGTGAKIYFDSINADGADPITSVDLTWDSGRGSIWVNGVKHAGGPLTVSGDALKNMFFVPNKDYSDADTKLGYVAHGQNGGTASGDFTITVDAVAQMPENLASGVDYGAGHTAAGENDGHGNDGTVTVRISGEFADNDGSEKHYALIEKQPGFSIKTTPHDEVYHGGKTYYRVEIPAGQNSVDVPLQMSGTSDYTLKTGLMSEEMNGGAQGHYEADRKNDIAWNLDGEVKIEFSLVDTTVSVNIPNQHEFTPGMAAVPVAVNWTTGANDTLNFIEFTYEASKGIVDYTGDKNSGNYHLIDSGSGVFTLRIDNPTDADKGKFIFRPTDYSDADINVTWKAQAMDSRSGDAKTSGSTVNVIVDAVAQAPDVKGHSFASSDGQHESARSGGSAVASVTLAFGDRDASETHYAVLQQDGVWMCDKATINGRTYDVKTVFGENGVPYYAIEVTNTMLDANGKVKVDFIVNAPNRDADFSSDLKIGGISLEPTTGTGGDKELNLGNNWDEGLDTVTVTLAMVDADKVEVGNTGALIEGDAAGTALNFSGITDPREVVTTTTYTVKQAGAASGTLIGTIIYNGVEYDVRAGRPVTINFAPDGFDADKDYRFVLADTNHNSGRVTIGASSTVQDTRSGDEKTFTDSHSIDVQATPDAPRSTSVRMSGLDDDAVGTDVNAREHFSYTATGQSGGHSDSVIDITLGNPPAPFGLSGFSGASAHPDAIYGGDGNALISAGKGDDILFGGVGADTFSWNANDLDNGTDIIRGFSYNDGDKLRIDIVAENDHVLNLHEILVADGDSLDMYLTATVNTKDITLQVVSGALDQTIILEMGTGAVGEFDSYDDFRAAYNGADEKIDQPAMLQQLLAAITC